MTCRHWLVALAVLAAIGHSPVLLARGDPVAGQAKAAACAACHGETGNSETPMYPKLAGQYESYLLQSMLAYKSGARTNAIMRGMVVNLSERDLADIAAFYARQKGELYVK